MKWKCHKILLLTIPLWILWQKLERGRENNVNKTLITHYLQKMLSFNGEERFFLRNSFKVFTNKCTFWIFSENFSYSVHFKLWVFLCENFGWKTDQKPLFWRFWDKEAFRKIFRKCVLNLAKDTPKNAKTFSKYFFFAAT